jgi:DNA-binding NarL/FixJ family response regulator
MQEPHPKKSIVIADIHTSFRDLLSRAIESEPDCEVVGQTGSGTEALSLCRRLAPDLLVFELSLHEMSGTELITQLQTEGVKTRTLIFTGSKNEQSMLVALRARPQGFVHKENSFFAFQAALRAVLRGRSFYCATATALNEKLELGGPTTALTERETTLLKLIAVGLQNKAIAQKLGISVKCVEHQRADLMKKLGEHDAVGLARAAVRLGLVS